MDKLKQTKTLYECDDLFTRILFGYESVLAYYADASSSTKIAHVQVPLLCLSAEDDPISPKDAIPYDAASQNGNVILCVTKTDGHMAFYEAPQPDDDDQDHGPDSNKMDTPRQAAPSIWSVKAIAD